MSRPVSESWHVPGVMVRAYVHDRLDEADAWSVEAHLPACADCRRAVAVAVATSPAGASVVAVGTRLLADLPEQRAVPKATPARRGWMLATSGTGARWAWLLAVVVTAGLAVVLDLLGRHHAASGAPGAGGLPPGGWLLAVAPVLPVLGVALSYGPLLDPAYEQAAATPTGGLRLVLWRTLAVLSVSLPVVAVAGWLSGSGAAAGWLLPGLALTALTLALGSVLDLPRAGTLIGAGWLALTLGPAAAGVGTVAAERPPALLWLALSAAGIAAVVIRREAYSRLPLARRAEQR